MMNDDKRSIYRNKLISVNDSSDQISRLEKAIVFRSDVLPIIGIDKFFSFILDRVERSRYINWVNKKNMTLDEITIDNPQIIIRVDDKGILEDERYKNINVKYNLPNNTAQWTSNFYASNNVKESIISFKYDFIKKELIDPSINDLIEYVIPLLNSNKARLKEYGYDERDIVNSINCLFSFKLSDNNFRRTEEIPCILRLMI